MITQIIGYLGGAFLTICGIPEVIRTIKDDRCHLGWPFLALWYSGEIFMLIYSLILWDYPLMMNYIFNFIVVSVLVFFKVKTQLK